jgi:oligoribonuclease
MGRMGENAGVLVKSDQNLVWLDCEMSGLDPDKERLLEIAVIVTGPRLEPRIEGPVFVIHQNDALLDQMDAWNKGTHGKSGLIDKVRTSTVTEAQAEEQMLEFLARHVPRNSSPMCGNTISQDRRFLVNYMPRLEAFFHYRNLDVSTLKELAKRWRRICIVRSRSSRSTRRWPTCTSRSTNSSTTETHS